MLIRLIYVSTSQDSVDLDEFKRILVHAQTNNERRDLTGMLAFNSKIFLQALEGDRDQVNDLYNRIARDTRHHAVTILSCKEIQERHWFNWSMGYAAPNADNRALFLKYSQKSAFNPYTMGCDAAEKMLMELANTTIAMTQPQALGSATGGVLAAPAPQPAVSSAANSGIFARFLKK